MTKEDLIKSIDDLLSTANERELKLVLQFMKNLIS